MTQPDSMRLSLPTPALIKEPWNGNTLLEWATQPPNGIEPTVIEVLIDHGADLDRALNLAGCWNLAGLCQQLISAGADPATRADADITPLESAAMHGSTDSGDVLITHGLHRHSLWLAAATGQIDLVQQWVDAAGALLRSPGEYRPNWADVGRPQGAPPTDDPAEILGEALVFAAANGRVPVVDYLLAVGVDVDSRPYRNTTGLHFAIQFKKTQMVRHLLRACAGRRSSGAPAVSPVDEFGGEQQGDRQGELGEAVSWPAVGVAA